MKTKLTKFSKTQSAFLTFFLLVQFLIRVLLASIFSIAQAAPPQNETAGMALSSASSLDNSVRLNEYLQFAFRANDVVRDEFTDYFTTTTQTWGPGAISTEGLGMLISTYVALYSKNPSWLSASDRQTVLNRAIASANKLITHQFSISDPDVNKRGGFEIHPYGPNDDQIVVWGTAPDVTALVSLYQATSNETFKTAAVNGAEWLLKAEDPSVPGKYRNYDFTAKSWAGSCEMDSAACGALFQAYCITKDSKYYINAIEAANKLVETGTSPSWWDNFSHYSLYAARDGLLEAYRYTKDAIYLDKVISYEASLPSNFSLNYEDAQAMRMEYELYELTYNKCYINRGNIYAENLWRDTYTEPSSVGRYNVARNDSNRTYLSGTIPVWILEAQALKSSFDNAPVIRSSPVRPAFPKNDLSSYLRTERFDNVYAFLAGDGVCALVDFRKERVLQIFAYKQFGTLQNLTYHVLYGDSYWFEGLHVYHATGGEGGKVLYPFRCQAHSNEHVPEIGFDATRAEAALRRVPLYPRGEPKAMATCNWSVRVEGSKIAWQADVAAEGGDSGRTGVEGTLYPLYNRVLLDGEEKELDYAPRASVLGGPWVSGKTVEFRDTKGRMPRLSITAEGGAVQFEAVRLTGPPASAQSLIFRAEAPGPAMKATLEVLPNPVAICVCPLMQEGSENAVRVLTTATGTPSLDLDGKAVTLKGAGECAWEGMIAPAAGRHMLVARLGDRVSERPVCAVGDFRKATTAMGDALVRVAKKTEETWPAQDGMIPQINNRDFSPRLWSGFIATIYYMPRTVMSLAAATLASGDPKYVDCAFRACRTYVLRSKPLGDGRFLAAVFSPDGTVAKEAMPWVRPSNFAIMARALLVCHTTFLHLKRPKEAAEALDLAYQVAMGLRAVQGPHGEWSSRYNYENPRYAGGNGFVNTPHYTFWRLAELLTKADKEKAAKVRALVSDHLASMPGLTGKGPVFSSAVGGDEDTPNDPQSWASATDVTLTKYLLNGEETMARRAAACTHAGIWVSDFYIDQPEVFSMPAAEWQLPKWAGGVMQVRSHGGMFDLVQEEVRVVAAEHLGDQFCADAAAYLFASRLAWAVEPDGYICGLEQRVPGHCYRNREYSETLNYGGVGIYALWYWQSTGR